MKNSLVQVQLLLCLAGRLFRVVDGRDDDAKRLYSSLMTGYNRLVRPASDADANRSLDVSIGLKLTQLSLVSVRPIFGRPTGFFFNLIFDCSEIVSLFLAEWPSI